MTAATGRTSTFSSRSVSTLTSTSKPMTMLSSGSVMRTCTGALLVVEAAPPPVSDEVIELISSPEEAVAVALT